MSVRARLVGAAIELLLKVPGIRLVVALKLLLNYSARLQRTQDECTCQFAYLAFARLVEEYAPVTPASPEDAFFLLSLLEHPGITPAPVQSRHARLYRRLPVWLRTARRVAWAILSPGTTQLLARPVRQRKRR